MDLKEIAEAYQTIYEKKADKDYDGDGKVESSKDEYFGSKDKAIKKSMGKDVEENGDDDKEDEKKDKKSDKKESLDLVSAYNSMYEHHQKDEDGNVIQHEDEEEVKEGIDLSFVDELSEEELDELVEGVVYDLLDEGIELDSIEGAFTQYLEEAKVTYGHDTDGGDGDMVAQVKKRKEEKAKASKEKAEKFKKSVTKAVDRIKSKPARVSRGLKAKAHSKLADYAGKRGLVPTKGAEEAAKQKNPKPRQPKESSAKYKKVGGNAKYSIDKQKYDEKKKNYDKVEKAKTKKQSAANLKTAMKLGAPGGKSKETRQKLRSAVFKDIKDRVGKKVGGAVDKVKSGVKGVVKSGRSKVGGGIVKAGSALTALGKKMQEQGGELDMFDTVTAYLIDEGLVRDFDHAQRVMTTLDSALIEEVHAEQMQLLEAYTVHTADQKGNTPAWQGYKAGKKNVKTGELLYKKGDDVKDEEVKKESLEDAYLKVYEGKGEGFGEKPEASEKKGEKKEKPKKEKITQQQRDFARKTFGGFNRKFGK